MTASNATLDCAARHCLYFPRIASLLVVEWVRTRRCDYHVQKRASNSCSNCNSIKSLITVFECSQLRLVYVCDYSHSYRMYPQNLAQSTPVLIIAVAVVHVCTHCRRKLSGVTTARRESGIVPFKKFPCCTPGWENLPDDGKMKIDYQKIQSTSRKVLKLTKSQRKYNKCIMETQEFNILKNILYLCIINSVLYNLYICIKMFCMNKTYPSARPLDPVYLIHISRFAYSNVVFVTKLPNGRFIQYISMLRKRFIT